MAGRRLKLTRKQVVHVNYQWLGAFRLRVEVTDPDNTGADPNVFIYLKRPVNPYDGTVLADWHGIASAPDMTEYPVGEPWDATTLPFFRLDYFEIDLRSTALVEETWALIVAEVDQLLRALDRLEQLVVTAETYVGAEAEGSSASESSSGSQSNSQSDSQSGSQ